MAAVGQGPLASRRVPQTPADLFFAQVAASGRGLPCPGGCYRGRCVPQTADDLVQRSITQRETVINLKKRAAQKPRCLPVNRAGFYVANLRIFFIDGGLAGHRPTQATFKT